MQQRYFTGGVTQYYYLRSGISIPTFTVAEGCGTRQEAEIHKHEGRVILRTLRPTSICIKVLSVRVVDRRHVVDRSSQLVLQCTLKYASSTQTADCLPVGDRALSEEISDEMLAQVTCGSSMKRVSTRGILLSLPAEDRNSLGLCPATSIQCRGRASTFCFIVCDGLRRCGVPQRKPYKPRRKNKYLGSFGPLGNPES